MGSNHRCPAAGRCRTVQSQPTQTDGLSMDANGQLRRQARPAAVSGSSRLLQLRCCFPTRGLQEHERDAKASIFFSSSVCQAIHFQFKRTPLSWNDFFQGWPQNWHVEYFHKRWPQTQLLQLALAEKGAQAPMTLAALVCRPIKVQQPRDTPGRRHRCCKDLETPISLKLGNTRTYFFVGSL